MRSIPVLVALALTPFLATSSRAQFMGELRLSPDGCQGTGLCVLDAPIRFKDSAGVVWKAGAGLVTDGASIPDVFEPFVGAPFEERFIRAAVIHDHYCDRRVRPWLQTHRVFYEALVDQGVSEAKAKTMYFAVLLGGPKWVKVVPGETCDQACVYALTSAAGSEGFWSRPADFGNPSLPQEMAELLSELESDASALTLEQIEGRAKAMRPGDFFFANGDEVPASSLDTTK